MILALLLAGALGVLAYAGYLAARAGSEGLLLIVPQISSLPGPSLKALEETGEDRLALTYEVISQKRVKAVNASYQARLIGTNYAYPQVMRYRMLSGAFFTRDAQKAGDAQLILNKKAAFELFGAVDVRGNVLYLDNVPYLVVGTIDDLDEENRNIYVPAARLDVTPNAFACRLDEERGVTQAYVWNVFKQLGVTQSGYDEIPLGLYGGMILQKCLLALYIALLAAVLLGMRKATGLWRRRWGSLRRAKESYYVGELIRHERSSILALLGIGIGMLAATAGMLYFALYMLQSALDWPSAAKLAQYTTESFARNIREMQPLCAYADISLIALALLTAMLCIDAWKPKRKA